MNNNWKEQDATHVLRADSENAIGDAFATRGRRLWNSPVICTINILLLLCNAAFFIALLNQKHIITGIKPNGISKITYSPVETFVDEKAEIVDLHPVNSPFAGEPRLEVDNAWSQLLRGTMVILSEDEMMKMNKTSVKLKDGTGYVGNLETFHMLHCVKRMYQQLHPEHYPDLSDKRSFTYAHLEHCFEALRKGIMCRADLTVNTFHWDSKEDTRLIMDTLHPRKCVAWDRIMAWADERSLGTHYERLARLSEKDSFGPQALLP